MPKTLATSVSASAGMPSCAARSMASSMRTMPSFTEYSLCILRWTKRGAGMKKFYYHARTVNRAGDGLDDERLRFALTGLDHSDLVDRLARRLQRLPGTLRVRGR